MKNTYKLVWTEESLENIKGIIKYLEDNWTEKEIKKFVRKLDHILNLIQNNPKLFPKADPINLRKAVVTKQVSLYYRIERREVHLLSLFDTRQHPDRLKGN